MGLMLSVAALRHVHEHEELDDRLDTRQCDDDNDDDGHGESGI